MFQQLVGELRERFPGQLDTFTYYLDRYIQLDEEVHAPLAQQWRVSSAPTTLRTGWGASRWPCGAWKRV